MVRLLGFFFGESEHELLCCCVVAYKWLFGLISLYFVLRFDVHNG